VVSVKALGAFPLPLFYVDDFAECAKSSTCKMHSALSGFWPFFESFSFLENLSFSN
jgi:hypothetical protein